MASFNVWVRYFVMNFKGFSSVRHLSQCRLIINSLGTNFNEIQENTDKSSAKEIDLYIYILQNGSHFVEASVY